MDESSQVDHDQGRDYEKKFDPITYLERCFKTLEDQGVVPYILKCLHEIYSSAGVVRRTLLDIGTGPCLHTVLPATKYFTEIYLSDVCTCNLETLQQWLNKNINGFDWKPYVQYYCDFISEGITEQELEAELRGKIKVMYKCDIHNANPLHPLKIEQVDSVSSCLCLDSACPDIQSYRSAMQHMVSLLKKGGSFILVGLLNSQYYLVGDEKFSSLFLSKKDVFLAVENAGLKVEKYFDELEFYQFEQTKRLFVLLATKVF